MQLKNTTGKVILKVYISLKKYKCVVGYKSFMKWVDMEENNLSKSTHRQLLNKVISKYILM